ncbi:MAG: hypothetical protein N2111_11570 [Candidatus Sumerlaeaceae bacterium]|nr:hypothetical protein [Candidatus Sumerlaeaceae bacterium]
MSKRNRGDNATTNRLPARKTKFTVVCMGFVMDPQILSKPLRAPAAALVLGFLVVVASALVFSGCTTARPAGAAADAALTAYQPAVNGQFAWATREVTATGRGSAPAHLSEEPQRSLAGKQAAKAAAISELKRQVAALPVDPTHTVGAFMDESLGLKRAIDRHVQQAQVIASREVSPGLFEVTLRTPLAPVADILKQFSITPGNLPPPPPAPEGAVPRDI